MMTPIARPTTMATLTDTNALTAEMRGEHEEGALGNLRKREGQEMSAPCVVCGRLIVHPDEAGVCRLLSALDLIRKRQTMSTIHRKTNTIEQHLLLQGHIHGARTSEQ